MTTWRPPRQLPQPSERGLVASTTSLEIKWDTRMLKSLNAAWSKYPKIMQEVVRVPTVQSLTLATRHLKIYPPKRPQQTYRRTLTLGRRWTFNPGMVTSNASKALGMVWNTTPYAQWVQDERRQPWYHRGRWTTVQQVLRGPFRKLYILYYTRALARGARNLVGF